MADNCRHSLLTCILSPCIFFLAVECIFAIWGVQPIFSSEDSSVGFIPQNPLFVKRSSQNGQQYWTTADNKKRYFNTQKFSSSKSPGTLRIFCMGGSTTYGRPFDDRTSFCGWLRAYLQALYPTKLSEVINAGGISYASHRVVLLMEEIVRYDPDLFIVYTGHNEFLENVTYSKVKTTPPWILAFDNLLNKTRVYSVLKRLVESLIYGRIEASGSGIFRTSLPEQVDALLDRSIGPDAYHRNLEWRRQVSSDFRENLRRMAEISEAVHAQLVFVVPASNLKDNSPFKSEPDTTLSAQQMQNRSRYLGQAQRAAQDGYWFGALSNLRKAERIDPVNADIQYHLGQIYFAAGDFKNAKLAFQRSIDEDVCPLRALSSITDLVNEVAAEMKIPVVDFRAILEFDSYQIDGHNILGDGYFYDHVHPRITAHQKLAIALLHRMNDMGILVPTSSWSKSALARVSRSIMRVIDHEAQGRALKNLAKVFSWAGKSKDAARFARQALETLGPDPELYLILGLDAYTEGHPNRAINYYRKSLDIETEFAKARNNLGIALSYLGRYDQAVLEFRKIILRQPDHAGAHVNLANALSKLGKTNDALMHYLKALTIEPRDLSLRKLIISLQSQPHLQN